MSYGFAEGKSFKIRFVVPFGGQISAFFNLFYYDLVTTLPPAPLTTTGFIGTTIFPATTTNTARK